ncbi:TetR family transcriptional regulator [Rhodophyticola sp. CCM32]|uniref:TetR family transcriptional regulator n=1 Tax=Rhodophyticola sp. CCM32 TaxID=2916397 RepID=UPI00107F65E6|nr:TetR family transcriptional regulator [Rhodophyticola sp. CCM32]QBX99515.1 TetR family transcriptional regulator [Rhodophyticola sp. CCM32]
MNESLIHDNQKNAKSSRRRGPKRSPAKLEAIARAARHVLAMNGPRLTQIADVAQAAGVAAGTVYVYISEKEALIELAILYAARFDLPDAGKPVKFSAARLKQAASRALEERLDWPVLKEAALRAPPSADVLAAVLSETYDMLRREHQLITLLDSCSKENAVLERLYTKGQRSLFFRDFETCIDRLSMSGYVRRDLDIAAASRAAVEMLVWMAMRRPGDRDPPLCDDAAARSASIGFAIAGLTNRG